MKILKRFLGIAFTILFLSSCFYGSIEAEDEKSNGSKAFPLIQSDQTPANFKVAFIGDSGNEGGFRQVLQLIKDQKAQMVIHLGDFAYEVGEQATGQWNDQINKILGRQFPYFMVVGNHDIPDWAKYQKYLSERLQYLPPNTCRGFTDQRDLGIDSQCSYQGLYLATSGIGVMGSESEYHLEKFLRSNAAQPWKICAWHKNQRDMQAGAKTDEVGWRSYQLCQKYGAMIVTGHEHSYARTRTLTALGKRNENHGAIGVPNEVSLGIEKTFVISSGIGGHSRRPWYCSLHDGDGWWASVFTTNFTLINGQQVGKKDCSNIETINSQQSKEYGALFIEFNYQGQPRRARGQFIIVSGKILDDFMIIRD